MSNSSASTPWAHWSDMSATERAPAKHRITISRARRYRAANGDQRLPLYQLLRDDLAAKIAAGTWKLGVPLPSETALAESYGVSLGTMRHAIEQLVSEGMLERRQGSGTYLRRPDFSSSMFRFFRFQPPGGETWLPESRILSRTVVAAPTNIAARLEIAPGSAAIRMARLRLYNGEPFAAEDIWLPEDRFKAFLEVPLGEVGPLLYPVYESVCGQMVAHIEESLTIATVDAVQARLLGVAPGTPAAVIERLARGHGGARLEWRRSHGRADRFNYNIEIR